MAWVMVAISIGASLLSSQRNKYCMILYMITASWWSLYNLYLMEIPCYQQGWLRIYYVILAIYSFGTWKKKEHNEKNKIKMLEDKIKKLEQYKYTHTN